MKQIIKSVAALTLTGAVAAALTGCANFNPSLFGTNRVAKVIYAVQDTPTSSALLEFTAQSLLSHTPTASITAPAGLHFESVAVASDGTIYAGVWFAASPGGEVLVFAPGATGAATPIRIINGSSTSNSATFFDPTVVTVGSNGLLYVGSPTPSYNGSNTISVFSATASGTAAPLRVLGGAATQLDSLLDLAVDSDATVYASDYTAAGTGKILTFAATKSGNVAPNRVILTTNSFYGIAVDQQKNIHVVVNSPAPGNASIVTYGTSASGYAIPSQTIAGGQTGLQYAAALRMDRNQDVYVVNLPSQGLVVADTKVFAPFCSGSGGQHATQDEDEQDEKTSAPSCSGNVPPVVDLTSTAWNAPNGQMAIY